MKYLKLLADNINAIGCFIFLLSGVIEITIYFAGGQVDEYLFTSSKIDFVMAMVFSILMRMDKKC